MRVVYIPPKQSLDGAPERLRLVSGAVRAAYIPPKQSLDGKPERLRLVRGAVRVVYIPPKQSLDGTPERLRLVSGAVRVADPTSQKRDMGTRAVRWGRSRFPSGMTSKRTATSRATTEILTRWSE